MTLAVIFLLAILCVTLLWLFGMKLVVRLMKGRRSAPCPASLGWLVDLPIRRHYMRHVLDRVDIRPGETVLELGPGPGAFTVDAARRVGPRGKLVAVDIQPAMIAKVRERIQRAGCSNVETHVAGAYELPLPDASVDRAFMITVLPEIPNPVRGLREIYRVLKPGGVFSTTEEFLDPDYPMRRTATRWAVEAGLQPAERHGTFWVYTLSFRKPL